MATVVFHYLTGLATPLFDAAELHGGWDATGRPSEHWSVRPMEPFTATDGCPGFRCVMAFPAAAHSFPWGVRLRRGEHWHWGITEEINDPQRSDCLFQFSLDPAAADPQHAVYRLNWSRHLGAQKLHPPGGGEACIQFAV